VDRMRRSVVSGQTVDQETNSSGDFVLRVRLLGAFGVSAGSRLLSIGVAGQRLVAMLALTEQSVSRSRAAATLWPDIPESRASANLRSTLWRLLRLPHRIVEATPFELRLLPDWQVDTRELVALARLLLDRTSVLTDAQLSAALRINLYEDLLPNHKDEAWLQPERERFRQLRLHCLEALCERLTNARWHGAAVDCALAAVRADPHRESASIALINAHLAQGNYRDAARHYEAYRSLLRQDFGAEPSPLFNQALLGRTQTAAPDIQRNFSPLRYTK
jgi:DNA-binding SARP family transcriptional activator